ncbi:hypothetical protein SUGI_1036710 [Cryptomeria japonica]|nr:hypothetical protein SUGI_1036710 [Cryptomeria japonica]
MSGKSGGVSGRSGAVRISNEEASEDGEDVADEVIVAYPGSRHSVNSLPWGSVRISTDVSESYFGFSANWLPNAYGGAFYSAWSLLAMVFLDFTTMVIMEMALSSIELEIVCAGDDPSSIEVELDVAGVIERCWLGVDGNLSLGCKDNEAGLYVDFSPSSSIEVEFLKGLVNSMLLILKVKVMRALLKPMVIVEGSWKNLMFMLI